VSFAHHDSAAPPVTAAPPAAAVPPATAPPAEPPAAPAAPRSLVRSLYGRFAHLVHEMGKFGLVGIVAFVVDLAVFNVLNYRLSLESLTSATISMALASTVAFIGNRFWTWRHRERSGLRREYLLYFFFNVVGLLIALACLAVSTYGLGAVWPIFTTPLAENISKMIVGGALGTVFRFWSYRTIVFREVSQAQ
jgi:putative flippase GtrA